MTGHDEHKTENHSFKPEGGFHERLLLHVDHALHQRVNIFLLAQAVMIAALAAVWGLDPIVALVICAMGVLCVYLLWDSMTQLRDGFDWLVNCVDDALYTAYRKRGRPQRSWLILVDYLPRVFGAFWIIAAVLRVLLWCWFGFRP